MEANDGILIKSDNILAEWEVRICKSYFLDNLSSYMQKWVNIILLHEYNKYKKQIMMR